MIGCFRLSEARQTLGHWHLGVAWRGEGRYITLSSLFAAITGSYEINHIAFAYVFRCCETAISSAISPRIVIIASSSDTHDTRS